MTKQYIVELSLIGEPFERMLVTTDRKKAVIEYTALMVTNKPHTIYLLEADIHETRTDELDFHLDNVLRAAHLGSYPVLREYKNYALH